MKNLKIEKKIGSVKAARYNLLVDALEDMQELEDWEMRLEKLKVPYTVAYRNLKNKTYYYIFCDTRLFYSERR